MKLTSSQNRLHRAPSASGHRKTSPEGGAPGRGSRRGSHSEHGAMNHAIRCREADDEIRDLFLRY